MTTSPAAPPARPASPRRQQFVNAVLVGTVVVVLGFASGIGVETSTSATQAAPVPASPTAPASTAAPTPTRTPINYIGTAAPPPAAAVQPAATTSTPSAATAASTAAARPTTTPHTTTAAPAPVASCPSDVLDGLLDSALGLLSGTTSGTQGSGLLSLVSGLLGGSGSTPLDGVLDLLGFGASDSDVTYAPFPTVSDSPALTSACEADLLSKLSVTGGAS